MQTAIGLVVLVGMAVCLRWLFKVATSIPPVKVQLEPLADDRVAPHRAPFIFFGIVLLGVGIVLRSHFATAFEPPTVSEFSLNDVADEPTLLIWFIRGHFIIGGMLLLHGLLPRAWVAVSKDEQAFLARLSGGSIPAPTRTVEGAAESSPATEQPSR